MQKLQDLLWLWMVLGFTILPAIRQVLVQMKRKAIIARIERKRGTKVITDIPPFPHLVTPGAESQLGVSV